MRTDSLAPFLAALLLLTAPQTAAAAHSRQKAPKAAPSIPSDKTLERTGAVIGRIDIHNENIFDLKNPKDDNGFFRLANRLHPVTRQATIREQLLFHPGEKFSRHLLEESARILRANPYFYDASIRPIAYHDGKVDILVVTRDVWTLNPGFNFSRSGGKSETGFQIEDINTLGTGTDVKVAHSNSVDRSSSNIEVMNPHTLGTWFTTDIAYGTLSDGRTRQFIFNRPFYALETRHAGGITLNDSTEDNLLWDRGRQIDRFSNHSRFYQIYSGFSHGLENGWTRRYSAGLTYDQHVFSRSNFWSGPSVLPTNRKWVYPWLRYDLVQDEFVKLKNHNQIGRTEDFDLGAYFTAQAGWADTGFGSSRNAFNFMLASGDGYALTGRDTLLVSSVFTGRMESGTLHNGVLDGAVRFYAEQSRYKHFPFRDGDWLFFATLTGSAGKRLDLENQILLGGDNGLRGYPLRYQDGTSRALLSVEERYFSDWYPFRLFRVGAAAFFDMGRTWGRGPLAAPSLGLLEDAGFGLRLGNARTGLGNVIHIDLAFPFAGGTNIKHVQFLVQTEQEF